MNKKFSTLMAGLMLASAFSVASAQSTSGGYDNGKYYLLGNGTRYITVVSAPGEDYGKLLWANLDINGDSQVSLEETRNALWKVTVTQENMGDTPKYQFVNVATGQYLSVPTPSAIGQTIPDVAVSGNFMEWYNGLSSTDITVNAKLMSYVTRNEVVYLQAGATALTEINGDATAVTSNTAYPLDVHRSEVGSVAGIEIQPYKAAVVALGVDELNKELIMNSEDDKSFTLSFNRDVTEGSENLFTGVELVATDDAVDASGNPQSGYVRLHVKDTDNYLVVDTALHDGSEASRQLPKFAYDDPDKENVDGNNVNRNPKSFNFKFAYEPTDNRVLIKVQEYYTRAYGSVANTGTVNWNVYGTVTGADGNTAYSGWGPISNINPSNATNGSTVTEAYVRLVELVDRRELTVAAGQADGGSTSNTEWTKPNDLVNGMLTNVTIGAGLMSYIPTTIPTGLYTIQYKGTNKGKQATDDYFIANLGGAFGYAEQAKNQLFDHIPAAQWYVEQQGEIATAPVKIWNREFFDQDNYTAAGQLGENGISYQAFQAPDGNYFFLSGAFNGDTLKFIPVTDASKADSLLGYKHVDAEQASVEIYNFNYLHGLSLDNGLNTPSDKDSLVRVDETGAKAEFRLVPVVSHDSYGLQLSADEVKATGINNLVRNAYYIKAYDNSKFEGDRYLKYDEPSKKYVMSTIPTPYFLKENNCIDGTHYYALVEANLYVAEAKYGATSGVGNYVNKYGPIYPAELAGKKVADLTGEEQKLSYTAQFQALKNGESIWVPFYAADGSYIVTDGSEAVALYAYQENKDGVIELRRVSITTSSAAKYYYMNPNGSDGKFLNPTTSDDYADNRVSVDDNTLDLTIAPIDDKWEDEIRVSAFDVDVIDNPLYRRFNGANGEFGTAANAPLNLKFYRHNNDQEFLFENYASENSYRDGITDKTISFLGVNNAMQFAESEARSYTMYVDTAYVRNNTRMPQYLIAVKPEVVLGDTTWCNATSAHHHETLADSLACDHTVIDAGFIRAMYLFNAQDSIDNGNYDYQGKAAYGAAGYTRLAFKDAVHAGDTLYILNPGVTTEQLQATNLKDGDLFAKKIFLGDNKHKNVVFQFRLIDSDDNRFLIESESEQNGAAVLNKDLANVSIAPMAGGWVKIQNGVPVIARYQDFNEAIAQADVFDVTDEIQYEATDNEEIAVEGVSVVAGDGQVTIMGAAGKNVTITNILGKVIASQVIASDNATIAVPAGIVAVAVEGEAAVKAIVK